MIFHVHEIDVYVAFFFKYCHPISVDYPSKIMVNISSANNALCGNWIENIKEYATNYWYIGFFSTLLILWVLSRLSSRFALATIERWWKSRSSHSTDNSVKSVSW